MATTMAAAAPKCRNRLASTAASHYSMRCSTRPRRSASSPARSSVTVWLRRRRWPPSRRLVRHRLCRLVSALCLTPPRAALVHLARMRAQRAFSPRPCSMMMPLAASLAARWPPPPPARRPTSLTTRCRPPFRRRRRRRRRRRYRRVRRCQAGSPCASILMCLDRRRPHRRRQPMPRSMARAAPLLQTNPHPLVTTLPPHRRPRPPHSASSSTTCASFCARPTRYVRCGASSASSQACTTRASASSFRRSRPTRRALRCVSCAVRC